LSNVTISVIMLTYNRETLVSRAIESIMKQTFTSFEFIIVDNGSTDRSGIIADEYAEKDSRIHVIHRNRGNIGSGRNAGLDAAHGEYLAFIDDDDWAEPDYLEFLHNLTTENSADISICGAMKNAFDEKLVMTAEEALIEVMWRRKYNVAFPAKMFRASLFEGIRFSENAKYDDIELMPRMLAGANCVAYHGLPKYIFFRHENNNSAWTTNHALLDAETLNEYLAVYRTRTEWLCERFPNNADAWKYFEWSFMISMVEKINGLGIKGCKTQLTDMMKELRDNSDEFLNSRFILNYERQWMGQYVYPN